MDGLVRAVLVVGVLNLLLLGVVACGEDGRADAALAGRVEALEAWKLSVEQRLAAAHNFMVSQRELNESMHGFMASAKDHAIATDDSVRGQRAALNQLAEIVKDMLKRK